MRVVHCMREPYTHYIGRPNPRIPKEHSDLGLGNPWSINIGRALAIQEFERWARHNPRYKVVIMTLPEDAVLGCWCAPKPCHGDVIITLWYEWHGLKRPEAL